VSAGVNTASGPWRAAEEDIMARQTVLLDTYPGRLPEGEPEAFDTRERAAAAAARVAAGYRRHGLEARPVGDGWDIAAAGEAAPWRTLRLDDAVNWPRDDGRE
jgi:hypothetical protein